MQVAFYSPLLSFQDRDLIALRITDANIKGASSATAHQPKVELLPSAVFHSLLCSEYLLNRDEYFGPLLRLNLARGDFERVLVWRFYSKGCLQHLNLYNILCI